MPAPIEDKKILDILAVPVLSKRLVRTVILKRKKFLYLHVYVLPVHVKHRIRFLFTYAEVPQFSWHFIMKHGIREEHAVDIMGAAAYMEFRKIYKDVGAYNGAVLKDHLDSVHAREAKEALLECQEDKLKALRRVFRKARGLDALPETAGIDTHKELRRKFELKMKREKKVLKQ